MPGHFKPSAVIIGVNMLTQWIINMLELKNKYTIMGLIALEEFNEAHPFISDYKIYNGISTISLLKKNNHLNLGKDANYKLFIQRRFLYFAKE